MCLPKKVLNAATVSMMLILPVLGLAQQDVFTNEEQLQQLQKDIQHSTPNENVDFSKQQDYSKYKVIRCDRMNVLNDLEDKSHFKELSKRDLDDKLYQTGKLLYHVDHQHSLAYIESNANSEYELQDAASLNTQSLKDQDIDVWAKNSRFIDIRVPKDFNEYDSEYCSVMIEDVQELITTSKEGEFEASKEEDQYEQEEDTPFEAQFKDPFFDTFQDLENIYNWMEVISQKYSTLVTLEDVGQTYEGREMKALHLGVKKNHHDKDNEDHSKKKTIVITGGVHAREWISVSSVLFVASQLLNRYGFFKRETRYLDNLDFFIIPVFNPDGYSYTWTHDRLWRKNRQQTYFPKCFGIDIDHSFDFKWTGTTDYPCSEDYSGEAPFEALEAEAWNNYLTEKTGSDFKLHGYLDFHSYSQEVLYPYGYSCDAKPRDLENLLELSYGLAKAIRNKSGKKYDVLSSCQDRGSDLTPGLGAGSALDYMYHHRAYWAFQLKLRDTGTHGFLLPSKFIRPVGKESYAAIKYFCEFILNPEL
ncbi:hypothetical protein ACO0QE_001119 [Hanseniaspora vineae]